MRPVTRLLSGARRLAGRGDAVDRRPLPPQMPGRAVGLWCLLSYVHEQDVPGDVVECGVGYGLTFYLLGRWSDVLGLRRPLWGFDSFAGFPPPTPEDASPRAPRAGEYGDATPEHVRRHFDANYLADVWRDQVRVVAGEFARSLPSAGVRQVALLHVDCELYRSYATVLDVLAPRLAEEGVIAYDDYASVHWPGATAAVNERLDRMGHTLLYSRLMNRYLSARHDVALRPGPRASLLWRQLAAEPVTPDAARPI